MKDNAVQGLAGNVRAQLLSNWLNVADSRAALGQDLVPAEYAPLGVTDADGDGVLEYGDAIAFIEGVLNRGGDLSDTDAVADLLNRGVGFV